MVFTWSTLVSAKRGRPKTRVVGDAIGLAAGKLQFFSPGWKITHNISHPAILMETFVVEIGVLSQVGNTV